MATPSMDVSSSVGKLLEEDDVEGRVERRSR
jgi:hypothetical protein